MLRPRLVCLNLQQDIVPGRACDDRDGALLWRMRECLQWARSRAMPVVHAQSVVRHAAAPPIAGFEARSDEIIIAKRSLSVFACDEWRRSTAGECRRVLLMGFSRRCDLTASALDGAERGISIAVIADAIGLERAGPARAAPMLCALLAPAIASITTRRLWAKPEALVSYIKGDEWTSGSRSQRRPAN